MNGLFYTSPTLKGETDNEEDFRSLFTLHWQKEFGWHFYLLFFKIIIP